MADYTNNSLKFDSNGNLRVTVGGSTFSSSSLGNGRKTVTTAGTPVALAASSTPCSSVVITALHSNTGIVCVGGTGVVAASGTRTGIPLSVGQSVSLPASDIAHVFVDSVVDGEGVAFCYIS